MNTVLQSEVQKFSKDSAHWWDPNGPFKPLHRLNPVRIRYIKQQICDHFERNNSAPKPFDNLNIIDVGCGGGLVCEPMTRLGANMTGLDADPQAIEVASNHAEQSGLNIEYRNETSDEVKSTFDVVLALEIIEHTKDPAYFVKSCAKLLKPGGIIIFSTLNRTAKSFALGVIAAEYILRWVPKGTHEWKSFVKPSELSRYARQAELIPHDVSGLVFNPLSGDFQMHDNDVDVNYFLSCKN